MAVRASRELPAAVVLCVAGAALVLLAAGRVWATAAVDPGAPLPPARLPLTGGDLAPGVPALGLLGLAGVAALLATRRAGRLAVGAVLLLAGAGVALLAVSRGTGDGLAASVAAAVGQSGVLRSTDGTLWPWAGVAGGVLLALGGLVTLVRGRAWSGLSARYEAPTGGSPGHAAQAAAPTRVKDPDVAAWEALDRGEDPTA